MTDDPTPDDDQEMMPTKIEPNRRELMAQALRHGVEQAIDFTRQDEERKILDSLDPDELDISPPEIHLHNYAPIMGTHVKMGGRWFCTVRCECGQEIVEVGDDAYRG